jgi:hypothetical protein
MNTTISPLRRIAVTLAMTGVTAFGAVAIAPAAFADDTVAVQPAAGDVAATDPAASDPAATDPAASDPAAVTPPPDVVYDKNGKPVKAPKVCTAKDLAESAKKVAAATTKAVPLLQLAAKSQAAAALLRAREDTMTPAQARVTELVAKGLDLVAGKLEAQAQAAIDKAAQKSCIVLPSGGRF